MLLNEKMDAAIKLQREKNEEEYQQRTEASGLPVNDVPLSDKLEKGDLLAMLISAFVVIAPVVLGALAVIGIVTWLFFFH